MGYSVLSGVSLVLIAGLMAGCCMLPLKFVRHWKWENVWLVFSIFSLVVIPWSLAIAFVGRLVETYRSLSAHQLAIPMLLGAGSGIAQILFGISLKRLGLGIAYAIIVGLGAVLGTVVPFFVQQRELAKEYTFELIACLSGSGSAVTTGAQILAIRPRRKVWRRCGFGRERHGKRADSHGLWLSVAERCC